MRERVLQKRVHGDLGGRAHVGHWHDVLAEGQAPGEVHVELVSRRGDRVALGILLGRGSHERVPVGALGGRHVREEVRRDVLGQADRVWLVRVLGDLDGERGGRECDQVGLAGVVEAQVGAVLAPQDVRVGAGEEGVHIGRRWGRRGERACR